MIGRARHLLQRIAVAIAACGSIHGVAYADLSWFGRDDPTRPSEPIRMSEIVAWSDACLDIDGGTWDAVIRIHRDYLDSWRMDLDPSARDLVADQRFFEGLAAALGEDRADCLAAMRAWRAVPTRLANDPESAAKLRREVLALAGARGTDAADVAPDAVREVDREARLAAQRLATELCQRMTTAIDRSNTRAQDELVLLLRAILPLRPRLIEALGKDRADRLQRSILLRADIVRPALLGERTRTMLALADRLSPDEHASVAAVYARADGMLDQHLLEGIGLPGPAKDGESPEARSAFERAWLATRARAERSVADGLEDVLGGERVSALRALALDGVSSLECSEVGNAAADAALARFLDPSRSDELARALGGNAGDRPWHPMQMMPLEDDELVSLGIPVPIARALLLEAIDPAQRDESVRAVTEALHGDHVARVGVIRQEHEPGLASLDALAKEDDRLFAEWTAAIGPDRVDAARLALVRLARAELCSARRLTGAMIGNVWVQAPARTPGSLALIALGAPVRGVPALGAAEQAQLSGRLAPVAPDWRLRLETEVRAARADAAQDAGSGGIIARVGRDGRGARAALERILQLIESLRGDADGGGAPSIVDITASEGALLATVEPLFQVLGAAERLEVTLVDDSGIPETVRTAVRRGLASTFIASENAALDRLRRMISDCRVIERLATRPDDAEARLRARDAALRGIEASRGMSYRREAAIADAWRVLRSEGVSAAKDAFRP